MDICPPVVAATQNSEKFVSINDIVTGASFMSNSVVFNYTVLL